MTNSPTKRRLTTLGVACFGTVISYILGLPLPFLFGPMLGCLIIALMGVRLQGVGYVAKGARTILGVAVGASVTPEVIGRLPEMALSVAFIPLYVVIIALVGVPFFRRLFGFDPVTAYYAAMPGGLQDMVIFGQEAGGDIRALSLIHTTRVLIIVSVAPIVLVHGFGASLDNPTGDPAASIPATELLLMVGAALIGWWGAYRVGLFGASILGPLIAAAILSLINVIHFRPPTEAILFAQFFIGIGIGVGYVGVSVTEIRRIVLAGVVYVLILASLAALFTELIVLLGAAPAVDGFLAFAPGGQAEMTVLAIVAGADLGYVIIHHLIRILIVITGAPLVARFLRARRS